VVLDVVEGKVEEVVREQRGGQRNELPWPLEAKKVGDGSLCCFDCCLRIHALISMGCDFDDDRLS
jgi:hypothetical protein